MKPKQSAGGWPVGYLQSVDELNLGLPNTNPASAREEDLNPGTLDYKSITIATRPRCILISVIS